MNSRPLALVFASLLQVSVVAQVPDRMDPTPAEFLFGSSRMVDLGIVSGPNRIIDLQRTASGEVSFASYRNVDARDPFFDPAALLDMDVPAGALESTVRAHGLCPAAVVGHSSAGGMSYAVACESARGRSWDLLEASSTAALTQWLQANPSHRPYYLDHAFVGGQDVFVLLVEQTPSGEGHATLRFGLDQVAIGALVDPRVNYVSAFQVSPGQPGRFDVILREYGPSETKFFSEFRVGPNADFYRVGLFSPVAEKVVSSTDYLDRGTLMTAAILTNNAPNVQELPISNGCPTALGFTPRISMGSLPSLTPGGFVDATVSFAEPSSVVTLIMCGVRGATPPFGLLPLDLAPFGAPGCLVAVPMEFNLQSPSNALGQANFQIPIPTTLRQGERIYLQGIALSPGVNDLGLALSPSVLLSLF